MSVLRKTICDAHFSFPRTPPLSPLPSLLFWNCTRLVPSCREFSIFSLLYIFQGHQKHSDNTFEGPGAHLSSGTCGPIEAAAGLGQWHSCPGLTELLLEAGAEGPVLELGKGLARWCVWMSTVPDPGARWALGNGVFWWQIPAHLVMLWGQGAQSFLLQSHLSVHMVDLP
jgi:hypothetical protein